jgi:hypothetical protein
MPGIIVFAALVVVQLAVTGNKYSSAATAPPGPSSPVCDTLLQLMQSARGREVAFVLRTTVPDPGGNDAGWPRDGCRIRAVDSTALGGTQTSEIRQWFLVRGWRDARYSADGPDGTMFAMLRPPDLCVIQGRWDGGDDTDTTYVPRLGDEAIIECVPAAPTDSARSGPPG